MALNVLMSLGGFWGNWQFGQEKWYFRKLMENFNL
jgi:hypothetical protein